MEDFGTRMQYPQLKNNNSHSPRIFMKTSQVIEAAKRFSKSYRITDGKKFRLTDVDPGDTGELTSEDTPRAREALQTGVQALAELQDVLYDGGRPTRAIRGQVSLANDRTRRAAGDPTILR